MNITNFTSRIGKKGLAKTNRFKVSIGKVNSESVSFYCESADFPGRDFQTTDYRIYGPNFKSPFISAYQDINMTVLCDKDLSQKVFFENWMESINPISTGYDFSYRDSYVAEIDIKQYDEKDKETYSCKLYEAYPVSLNPLTANWADDGFHRVQVSMTYRYWISSGTKTFPSTPLSINTIQVPDLGLTADAQFDGGDDDAFLNGGDPNLRNDPDLNFED